MPTIGAGQLYVEADLSGTAYGGSPTWTDLTQWVLTTGSGQPVSITWGRQDWLGDTSPSTCSVMLDNVDGRFTPGLTSSPYYPNVRRRVRLRVRMVISGTTVYLFDGYVDSWEASFENGVYGMCAVDATDILGRMGADTTLRGWLVEEMMLDSPAFLYSLQEAEGATSFGDMTTAQAPLTIGNSKYGAGEVTAGQDQTGITEGMAVTIANAASATYTSGPSAGSWLAGTWPGSSGDFTVEMWVASDGAPAPGGVSTVAVCRSPTFAFAPVFEVDLTGSTVTFTAQTAAASANVDLTDGNLHHVVGVQSGTTALLYVDGAVVDTGSGLTGTTTSLPFTIGMLGVGPTAPANPMSGAVAYFAAYMSALSATRIAAHYNAGANAFAGERTDTRITRLLTYRTDLGANLDAGFGYMGQQDISGTNLQDALTAVGEVEGGALYADGQARITLRSRSRTFNPTPVLTLDASQGQVDSSTVFREDMQNVVNDITVTRVGGSDQRYYDAASVAQDGAITQPLTLAIDTDANALAYAAWAVALGLRPQNAAPSLTVDLMGVTSTATVLSVLQRAPLDVVTASNLPAAAPATAVQETVQGGQLRLGVDEFTATFYTTPATPSVVQVDGDSAHGIGSSSIMAY